ncbi:DUF1254 domain-containing protein [Psychromonas aquimarina]|uniref:DUF1254 domain-containing protein n=1 Tax=Psychromonas aquimarina TaxID=444919 RepID=UPI00040238DC|nr:DUF1254 domain-containing protein [Psychromonas aquimarina]
MKKSILSLALTFSFSLHAAEITHASDAQLHAYKVFHHADYTLDVADKAGGTNKLIHTTILPTEGTDNVVTPALDHLYSKAVIDLSSGPVIIDLPEVEKDHYFSIHITDQEHYTIFDEIRPQGKYVFIHEDWQGEVPAGKVIKTRSTYPHLFIRTQVKSIDQSGYTAAYAVQNKIQITGLSKTLQAEDDLIKFTLDSHSAYPKNKALLESMIGNYDSGVHQEMFKYIGREFVKGAAKSNIGIFNAEDKGVDDPLMRALAVIGHLGLPEEHAYYAAMAFNCSGTPLNGDNVEIMTFPYNAGVDEFWSVTRYSSLTRNTYPGKNDLYNAYNTRPDADGNVTVTFSAEDPQDGTYWMPVNAGEPYYVVGRYYSPDYNSVRTIDDCGTPTNPVADFYQEHAAVSAR